MPGYAMPSSVALLVLSLLLTLSWHDVMLFMLGGVLLALALGFGLSVRSRHHHDRREG